MTPPIVRPAVPKDREALVVMMGEFYAEVGSPFAPEEASRAVANLLQDERLGRAWILHDGGLAAGYVVLTLAFSLEFGGRTAFVDDLFVRPPHRGQGLGRAAMGAAIAECRARGIRALHLEVARDNVAAKELYRRFGFTERNHQLMTSRLKSQ